MRFSAIVALVATASAIRIKQGGAVADEIFREVDQNGDQNISRDEAHRFFISVADMLFNATDVDNNGVVSKAEFENAIRH